MPIALGTDGGVPWEAHVQMVDMVAAGMTPAEVIVAATSSAARAVAIDDIGTLAPGMTADFIVLDANPLDDITNTRAISSVYIRGQQVGPGWSDDAHVSGGHRRIEQPFSMVLSS